MVSEIVEHIPAKNLFRFVIMGFFKMEKKLQQENWLKNGVADLKITPFLKQTELQPLS